MPDHSSPRLQPYHPSTFLERGVAVPFTTPLLAGTRARPMERGGTELIVPNPAGGDGVYVLPWNAVRDLCRPTMHDTRLNAKVAEIKVLTPFAIRMAAREIAAEGLAGRPACAAAAQAVTQDQHDRLLTNFMLLLELVKQGEPQGHNRVPPEREQPALLERRARWVIGHLAPQLGLMPDRIASLLEELASLFSPVGIGQHVPRARLPRLLEAVSCLRDAMQAWCQAHGDANRDASVMAATIIAQVTGLTLTCAEGTLTSTRKLVDDLPTLLRNWHNTPDKLAQFATRSDWLLDGWEHICLLWNTATTDAMRRGALAEMALMVPIIPREVTTWMEDTVLESDILQRRRTVQINEDWRTGLAVFGLIARNEHIRALAA